jgi:hypothetical protein
LFGFAHDKDKTPGPGDLAHFCVACPQPGINLPENWQDQESQSASSLVSYTLSSLNSVQVEIYPLKRHGWELQD